MSSNEGSQPATAPSRFAGTLLDVLDKVEYARIQPEDVTDPVYRLRYEAYRRENFLPYNSEEIYTDPLDLSPNAYTFGVFIDGRLMSSIRIHHITPDCRISPSLGVYEDVLGPMLDKGMSFTDPTRFTADHEASLAYPALPYLTLRLGLMASEHFGVDYCLQSVRPEHAAFYKRIFLSQPMGPQRTYGQLNFPIVLVGSHVPETLPRIVRRFPFFLSTREERDALFGGAGRVRFGQKVAATARLEQKLREEQALAAE
ncbi:N-acyl amino acid synthase FeeM domain-containing protein [Paradevosia shaoguanensis]|uniref:N-acyl amino acid synthase FeeM domain-containing protein n=1 Tax=Paradevosia shaoguanensis TaxID=1335043 RepID=UPI001934518A|nr:hypothetical protein [Paradevosia shaoguanensis]